MKAGCVGRYRYLGREFARSSLGRSQRRPVPEEATAALSLHAGLALAGLQGLRPEGAGAARRGHHSKDAQVPRGQDLATDIYLAQGVCVFVCGPPPMYKAICGGKIKGKQGPLDGFLKAAGFTEEMVFKF
eukprot:SAG11_NODE_1583_length_4644_cov_4.084708_3_plen_130_part_00